VRYIFLLIIATLLQANINIKSIKADFIQTITNDQNSTIKYSGTFFAKDDNRALWIYKKPIKKRLYFLDGKVVIIELDLEQVIFSNFKKAPKILEILKSAKQENGKLLAKCCDTIYNITIKDDKIISVQYKDKVGNKVLIKFKNEDTNIFLDNTIFKYQIPADFDIIREN